MASSVQQDGNTQSYELRDQRYSPGSVEEITGVSKSVTLVVPNSQLYTIRKALVGIGVETLTVCEVTNFPPVGNKNDSGTSVYQFKTEKLFRMEFHTSESLAKKATGMIATLLKVQSLGTCRIAIAELKHLVQVVPTSAF